MSNYDKEMIVIGASRATCHQALRDINELQHTTQLSSLALMRVAQQIRIALIKKDNVIHD